MQGIALLVLLLAQQPQPVVELSEKARYVWDSNQVFSREEIAELDELTRVLAHGGEKERVQAEQAILAKGIKCLRPLLTFVSVDAEKAPAIKALLLKFAPTHLDELIQRAPYATIVELGPEVIPAVIDFWRANPHAVDPARLSGFGRKATPYLLPLLEDPEIKLRSMAAGLLVMSMDPAAWEAMMKALQSNDTVIQKPAARYMRTLKDTRATEAFLRLTRHESWGMRESGLSGLASVYEPRFLGVILATAKWDSKAVVRDTACNAMENVGLPLLKRLAKRYRPQSYDPAAAGAVQLAQLMLFGTSVAFSTLIIGLRKWVVSKVGPGHVAGWVGLFAALSLGFVWGFVIRRVGGVDELAFLLIAIPFAMLVARVFNPSGPEGNKSAAKASSRWSAIAMYGGYAIGQTALWGGSLAWLWLGWPI
jgi:hypothetical protein